MYIRTKDRIYDFKSESICKRGNELFEIQEFFEPIHHINYKLLGKILKQADTIEELCDAVIIFYNGRFPSVHNIYQSKERLYNILKFLPYHQKVKLGIFTDDYLYYVAEMNENGGFDLI